MKWNIDLLLIVAIALSYGLGQLFATYRFAGFAGFLLLILVIRFFGGLITWTVHGR